MKIIIKGRPQNKRVLCGNCGTCGCVFTVEPEECLQHECPNGRIAYIIKCPNCKDTVISKWVDEDKIKPDYWKDN